MGLIVGILIGVFCRRYLTAFFWCLGLSLLVLGLLGIGAANDATMGMAGKIGILAIGFGTTLVFLCAGAMGTIAIKRFLANRKADAATSPQAEVFGPAAPAAARDRVSGV